MRGISVGGARILFLLSVTAIAGMAGAGSASAQITFDSQFSTGIARPGGLGDSMAVSSDGSFAMIDDESGRVSRFGADGDPLPGWKLKRKGPMAIAVDPADNVLVAFDEAIERFSATGVPLKTWSLKRIARRSILGFFMPSSIEVARSGNIYIVDFIDARIVRLSPDGRYLGEVGRSSMDGGRLMLPGDIAIGADERVYVTESLDNQVQIYGPRGNFLKAFGRPGAGDGAFESAESIATDELGRVYVGDPVLSRIQVFDPDGQYLDQRGSPGFGASRFSGLGDIVTAAPGVIHVADRKDRRIQRFTYTDGPHDPQAQLAFRGRDWVTSGLPGTRVELEFLVTNFGGLDAEDVIICPSTNHPFSRRIFRNVDCRSLDTIGRRSRKVVRFRVRVPRNMKKNDLRMASLSLRSANAGGGPLGMAVYTGRRFRWPDMSSARTMKREVTGKSAQSVAMRLRARGAP